MITTNAIPKECHMKMLPERDRHKPDRVLIRKAWNLGWFQLKPITPVSEEQKAES
jgi:hypothetical protein